MEYVNCFDIMLNVLHVKKMSDTSDPQSQTTVPRGRDRSGILAP